MVSWWYWCSLQLFLVVGLLLSSLLFSTLEAPREVEVRTKKLTQAVDLIEAFLLQNSTRYQSFEEKLQLLEEVFQSCNLPHPLDVHTAEEYTAPVKWSFPNAVLFSYTIVTTIGYGHISPETAYGRLLSILVGLVGIPVNVVLVGMLAGWFNQKLLKLLPKKSPSCNAFERRLHSLALPLFYLVPGAIFFLVIPGVVLTVSENWTFLESVYYAFITLTTVGFGDMVSGSNQKSEYQWLHNGVLILWIMFGLGYLTAVIDVIGKAFSSKSCQKCIHLPRKKVKRAVLDWVRSRFATKDPECLTSSNNNLHTDGADCVPNDTDSSKKKNFYMDNINSQATTLPNKAPGLPKSRMFYIPSSADLSYDNEGFITTPTGSTHNFDASLPLPSDSSCRNGILNSLSSMNLRGGGDEDSSRRYLGNLV